MAGEEEMGEEVIDPDMNEGSHSAQEMASPNDGDRVMLPDGSLGTLKENRDYDRN